MVVINYLYTLPFYQNSTGLAHKVLGDWQISGVEPVPDRDGLVASDDQQRLTPASAKWAASAAAVRDSSGT